MRSLDGNIDIGTSIYTGRMVASYLSCPRCNGQLHSYARAAHPHGHRAYSKCLRCTYGAWEHEMSDDILVRLELEREVTV